MRRPNVAFYLSLIALLYFFGALHWFIFGLVLAIGVAVGVEYACSLCGKIFLFSRAHCASMPFVHAQCSRVLSFRIFSVS